MSTTIEHFNSLSIATVTTDTSDICKAYISIDLHEANSSTDQAAFLTLGEMLLSGTSTQSRDELLYAINALGATVSITVTDGWLTIALTGHSSVWNKLITILVTLLTDSTFSAAEIKRVKELVKNALHDHKENARTIAVENLRNQFYNQTDRRATVPIPKLQKEVAGLKSQEIKAVYKRAFNKQWFVSVVGPQTATTKLTTALRTVTDKITVQEQPVKTTSKVNNVSTVVTAEIPSKQNIELSIGFPLTITRNDLDYIPLQFGMAVLCKWGGFAGRLMSTVREKEGLTYSIYGKIETGDSHTPGYFRIMTFFNPAQANQGLSSTFREIKKIHKNGITESELDSFKTILKTQTILRKDSPLRELYALHAYHRSGYSLSDIKEYESAFQSVSKAEVDAAIKKYLVPKAFTVSIAGPVKLVKKDLEKLVNKV